jgi:hypothetical protein
LGRFRVPSTAIVEKFPRAGAYYDVEFVKSKVGGLIGFFELRWADPKPRIGFRPQ